MKKLDSFEEFISRNSKKENINNPNTFEYKEYLIEYLVIDNNDEFIFYKDNQILEWHQYQIIPKTNKKFRYDAGNTNTKTQDHIHVYFNGKELYAINRDGTPHDGSKAKLGKKDIDFLKNRGFKIPKNNVLEWITLDSSKNYKYVILT